jgi:cytochrome c5
MFRSLIPVVFLLSVAATPSIAGGARPIELKTTQFDLPDGDRMFPDAKGADAINNNCLACHSAGMVLNQPVMSKEAWASEVKKMINNYKAPIAPEDVGPIVDYLVALKGAK